MKTTASSVVRSLLLGALAATALVACGKKEEAPSQGAAPGQPAAEEKVLNLYIWNDYLAPDTIANFEKETGIKVSVSNYGSNEELDAKLAPGNAGYDVVVPSASSYERQIKAGYYQKLDKSQLPNLKNMDPDIMNRVGLHDPNNEYAIPYLWGTTGIGYNEDKIKKILGDAKPDSWNYIYDPKLAAKFKDCGISLLDAPDEILKTVLAYLGRDPNSQKEEDLKAAEAKLMPIRPFIRKIHSSQYIDDLANGDLCIAVGWSGDILQARDRADEAKQGVKIKYAIPKEGTIVWFDMLAIPADAKHPKNAHAFINYLMDPQVAANNSNTVNYANGNAQSLSMVNDEVKNDAGIYPTPEVKAKLFPSLAYGEDFQRLMNRMWTKFQTGQ